MNLNNILISITSCKTIDPLIRYIVDGRPFEQMVCIKLSTVIIILDVFSASGFIDAICNCCCKSSNDFHAVTAFKLMSNLLSKLFVFDN